MASLALPDYFEFYGLPVSLSVDAAVVRRIFLDNSRKYHPDFHTLSSDTVQDHSLELSTFNNEAYKTLADPDRRLQYVLKIKGLFVENGGEEPLPQAFLMEMMEINEKIMELEFDPLPAQYQEALSAVNSLESDLERSFSPISHWSEESGNPADLFIAKEYFLKKRYLLRVKENLSKFASAFE